MKYRVMIDFIEKWSSIDGDIIVDDAEIARLARYWDCAVATLMEQVEAIDE